MRRTTIAKLGAGLTAAALALTLGTGPATAEDSGTQVVRMKAAKPDLGAINSTGAVAQPDVSANRRGAAALPTADIIAFGQKSIALYGPETYAYPANPNITNIDGVDGLMTRLTVEGVNKGIKPFQIDHTPDPDLNATGLAIPGRSPVGKAKLGPSTIYYNDDVTPVTADPTISSNFYIRRGTYSVAKDYAFGITRTGSKVKFEAVSWKIWQPSTGKLSGIRSIKLQYRHTNGTYSTYKTMSLNTYGTGSYTKTTSTKRNYRLLISTTDTILGYTTGTSPKI